MKYKLFLASESPRRRELLSKAGYRFQADSVKLSEIINKNLNPRDAIMTLAAEKAEAFVMANKHLKSQRNLAISADTMVVLGERCLGKPADLQEAREFLDLLSGKMHSVMTVFCLFDFYNGKQVIDYDETLVEFKSLTPEDIQAYLDTGEPMGKAGAYAIQGEGSKLVRRFQGSWSNVVGLPIEKLEKVIELHGWDIEKTEP